MSQRTASDFTIPGIITAAVAVIGWLGYRAPLESARPPQLGVSQQSRSIAADSLKATPHRLWDDPLLTYPKAGEERTPTSPRKLQALLKDIIADADDFVIFPVMVPGEYVPDSHEQRLRMRYAVSSAFAENDYHPVGGYATFYVDLPLQVYTLRTNQRSLPRTETIRVPTTVWVKNEENGPSYIVNIWVDETYLGMRPVESILRLAELLLPASGRGSTKVRIVGPAHSDTLKLMRANAKAGGEAFVALSDRIAEWEKVSIWSARATSPPKKDCAHDATQISDAALFRGRGIEYCSVIDTDEALNRSLIDELRLRGALPQDCDDRLILITESDTAYGRYWRDNSFCNLREQSANSLCDESRLVVHTFLRGIDGYAPKASADGKTKSLPVLARSVEAPRTGTSQFDYLLRVQEDIARLKAGGKRIRAVGVVGSDVYDKLLVLRALRAQLPNTCFFTTDLDVELWNADEIPFTRNLVVASHFGLRLADGLQSQTPPFRDSYQTSLFYATCLAIQDKAATTGSGTSTFEIGRSGPYHLDTKASGRVGTASLHPLTDRERGWWNAWAQSPYYVVCFASAVALLALAGVQFVSKPTRRMLELIGAAFRRVAGWLSTSDSSVDAASILHRVRGAVFFVGVSCAVFAMALAFGYWMSGKHAGDWQRLLLVAPLVIIAAVYACCYSRECRERAGDVEQAGRNEKSERAWLWQFVALGFIVPCLILPLTSLSLNWLECFSLFAVSIGGFWFLSVLTYRAGVVRGAVHLAKACVGDLFESRADKLGASRQDKWPTLTAIVIFSLLVVLATLAVVAFDHRRAEGEPFTFSGVSLWPITLSRALLSVVASGLLYQVFDDLDRNAKELKEKFFKGGRADSGSWAEFLSEPLHLKSAHPAMSLAWIFLAFACSLFALTDFPSLPYRGAVSKWIALAVLYLVVLIACLLTFTVFASIGVARSHIRALRGARKRGPRVPVKPALKFSATAPPWDQISKPDGDVQKALNRLTCIRILGSRTRIVGKLLQYPAFILLCVLLIHLTWLDGLDLSPQLLIVVGVLVVLPIAFYARLLHEAELLRKAYVSDIAGLILKRDTQGAVHAPQAMQSSEMLARVSRGIEQEYRGAYGPLLSGPIFKAMAIPLGGTGGLMLIQEMIAFLQ